MNRVSFHNDLSEGTAQVITRDSSQLPKGILSRVSYPIMRIGKKNKNGRVYDKSVVEKILNNKEIAEKIKNRNLFGNSEHPSQTSMKLSKDETSHIISRLYLDEDVLKAELDILPTESGKFVDTLLEAGCKVGTSTRANGELEEGIDEEDGSACSRVIPESYDFITVDFTGDPSTLKALPEQVQKNITSLVKSKMESHQIDKPVAMALLESVGTDEAKKVINEIKDKSEDKDNKEQTPIEEINSKLIDLQVSEACIRAELESLKKQNENKSEKEGGENSKIGNNNEFLFQKSLDYIKEENKVLAGMVEDLTKLNQSLKKAIEFLKEECKVENLEFNESLERDENINLECEICGGELDDITMTWKDTVGGLHYVCDGCDTALQQEYNEEQLPEPEEFWGGEWKESDKVKYKNRNSNESKELKDEFDKSLTKFKHLIESKDFVNALHLRGTLEGLSLGLLKLGINVLTDEVKSSLGKISIEMVKESFTALNEEVSSLKNQNKKTIEDISEKHKKSVISNYVQDRVELLGLKLPESQIMLLETCTTKEEVENILERFRDRIRESKRHIPIPGKVVQEVANTKEDEISKKVRLACSGIR